MSSLSSFRLYPLAGNKAVANVLILSDYLFRFVRFSLLFNMIFLPHWNSAFCPRCMCWCVCIFHLSLLQKRQPCLFFLECCWLLLLVLPLLVLPVCPLSCLFFCLHGIYLIHTCVSTKVCMHEHLNANLCMCKLFPRQKHNAPHTTHYTRIHKIALQNALHQLPFGYHAQKLHTPTASEMGGERYRANVFYFV